MLSGPGAAVLRPLFTEALGAQEDEIRSAQEMLFVLTALVSEANMMEMGGDQEPAAPAGGSERREEGKRPLPEEVTNPSGGGAPEPAASTGSSELPAVMADALDERAPKRRRLPDGIYYSEADVKEYYGHDTRKAEEMWEAGAPEPGEGTEGEVYELVAQALWPHHAPQRVLLEDGFYHLGAAVVPAQEAVEGVFKVLMHYRNVALRNRSRSTGAAEPGDWIQTCSLDGEELGLAWRKWREDFLQSPMYPWQDELRKNDEKTFLKNARSWHLAHVEHLIGDTHVAKAVIQHGVQTPEMVGRIIEEVGKLKQQAREARDASGGAREPAERRHGASREQDALRAAALTARAEFREGRKIARLVEAETWEHSELNERQQRLLDEFLARTLHKRVDAANAAYGYGVMRTNDYGVGAGEQMCQTMTLTQRVSAILQLSAGWSTASHATAS